MADNIADFGKVQEQAKTLELNNATTELNKATAQKAEEIKVLRGNDSQEESAEKALPLSLQSIILAGRNKIGYEISKAKDKAIFENDIATKQAEEELILKNQQANENLTNKYLEEEEEFWYKIADAKNSEDHSRIMNDNLKLKRDYIRARSETSPTNLRHALELNALQGKHRADAIIAKSNYLSKTISDEYDNLEKSYRDNVDLYIKNLGPTHQWLSDELESIYAKSMQLSANEMADATATAGPLDGIIRSVVDLADSGINLAATVGSPIYTPGKGFFNLPSSPDVKPVEGLLRYLLDYKSVNPHSLISDDYSTFDKLSITYLLHALAESAAEMGLVMFQGAKLLGSYNKAIQTERGVAAGVLSGEITEASLIKKVSQKISKNLDKNIAAYKTAGKNDIAERIDAYKSLLINSRTNTINAGILNTTVDTETAAAIMGTIAGTYSRPGFKSFIKESKMPIALAGIDILRRVSDLAAERDGGQIYAKDFVSALMHWGVDMAGGVAMVAPAIKTLPNIEAKQSLKEILSPSAFKKIDFLDKVADIGVGAVTEGYGEMIQTYLELQAANDYRLPSLSAILNSTLPSMRQYRDILTEAGTLGAALGGGITATVEIGSSAVNKFKNKNKDDDGNGGNPPSSSSSSSDDSSITGGINPTRDDAGETLDRVKNDQASKDSYAEKQKRVNDLKEALDQTAPSDVDKKQRTEESKKAEAEQQALARLEKRAQKENEVKEKEAKIKNVDKKDVNKINGKNKSYSVRRDEINKAARQLKSEKNKLEKKLENTKLTDDEAIDIADKIADIDERLDLVSEVIDGLNELETGAKVDAILSELSNVLTTSVTQEAGSNTVNKAGLLDAITRLENAKTQDEFSEAMKDIVDNSNITSDQLQKAIEYQRNAGVADSKTTQQTLTGNQNKGKQDTESNKGIESKQNGGSSGINDSNTSNNQTSTDIDNNTSSQQSDSKDNVENNATQDNTTDTSAESTATTETTSGTEEVQKTLNARDIKDLETRRNLLKSLPPELIARAMVEGSGRPSFSNTNRSSLPTNNRSKLWQEFVEKYLIVPISKDLLNDGSSPVQSKQKVNETILGDNDVEIFVIENQYIDENGEIAYYNAKNGITSKISTLLTNIARLHNQEISNIISNITKEMEKENANPETIANNIETLKQKYMEELQSVHDNLSLLEYLAHITRGTPLQHKISQISYSLMRRLDKQRTELQNIAKELKTRLGIDIESSFDIDVSSPVKEQDNSKYDGLFTALSKTTTSIFKSVRRAIDTYYKIKNQGDQKEAKNARSKIINVIHRIGKALKALVDIRANDEYATMYNTVVESLHRIGIEMYIQNRIDGFKYNIFGTEFTLNPKMEFIHKYFQDLFLDFLNRSYGTDIKTTILDAMLNNNANIQHLALFKDFLNDIEISETLIQEIFPSFKSGVVGSSNVEQRKYSLFDILAPSDPTTVKALLKEEEIQQALGQDQSNTDIPVNDENIMANIDKIRDTIRNRIFSSNAGKDIKLRLRASILSNQTAIEKMDNLLDIGLFIHLNAVSAQSVVAGEGNQTVREQKLLALQTQFVKNMLDYDKKYTEYEINQFISAANILAATYLQSKTYNGKPIETVVGDENHPTDLVLDPDFLADYSLHFKYRADAAMNLLKEKTEITNDITDLKMLIAASPMPNSVRLQNLMALQETAISFDETSLAALKEIGIDEDTLLNAMKDPNNVLNDPIEYNKKKEEWIEHADTVEARVRMLQNGRDFFGNYYRVGFNTVQDGQIMTTFKYVYIPDLAIKCNEKGDALILPKNKKWLLNYGIDINDAASTKEFLDQILIQTDEVVSQDTGDINTSSAILDKIENRNAELGQLMFGLANMKKRNEISEKARVSGRDVATELAEAINNETDENVKSVLLSKVDYSQSFYFGYRIEPNGRMGTPYAQSPVSSKLLRGVTAKRPPNKYYSYEDIKAIRDIVNSDESETVKREKVKAINPTGNSLYANAKWGYRYAPKPKRDENGNVLRDKKGKIIYETSKNGKIIYERVRNTQPKSKQNFAQDKRYDSARQGQLLGLARVFGLDIEKFTETADGRFIYEIKGIDRAALSNIDTQKIRFVVSRTENGKVDINLTSLYNALISDDNPVDSAEAAVMLNDIISYFKQKKFDSWSIADDHFGEVIRNLTEFEKGFEKDSNGNIVGFDARNVDVSRLAIYGDGSATLHMQNSVRFRNIEMALALTGVYASVDGKFVSNAEKYAEYKRVKQAIQRRVEELTSDENELLTPAAKANIRAIMEKKGIDAHTFPLITAIMSAIPLSGVSLVSKLVAETNIADRDFSKSIFTPSAYGAGEKSFFEKEKESSGEVLKVALVNTAREFFGKSGNIKDIYDLLDPKFSGDKEQLKKNITARFLAHIKNKTEVQNSKEARALSSFVDFYNQSEAKKSEAVSMLFSGKNLNKIFKNFDNNSLSENKNHINVIALQKSIQTMLDNDIATSDKYAKHFGIPTINNGFTVVAMSQDAFNAALKVAEALNDKDSSKKKFIFFKLQEFKDEFDELLRQIQADKDAPTKQFRTKHFTLKFGENKEIQIEVNPENSIRNNFMTDQSLGKDQSLGIEDKDITDASSIITNTFVYYLETNGSFLPDHRPLSLQSNPLLTIPRQSAEWVNEVTPMIQTLAIQRALNIADDILIDYIRGNNEDGSIDKDGKKTGKVYNELYTDGKPDKEKIKKRLASDAILNQKISKRIAEELEQFNKQVGRLAWGERGEYVSPLSAKPDSDQRSAGFAQIQSMAEQHISQSVFPLQTKIGVTLQDSVVQLLANVSYLSPNVSGLFNQPFEGFTLGSNMGGMNNQIFDGFEFNGATIVDGLKGWSSFGSGYTDFFDSPSVLWRFIKGIKQIGTTKDDQKVNITNSSNLDNIGQQEFESMSKDDKYKYLLALESLIKQYVMLSNTKRQKVNNIPYGNLESELSENVKQPKTEEDIEIKEIEANLKQVIEEYIKCINLAKKESDFNTYITSLSQHFSYTNTGERVDPLYSHILDKDKNVFSPTDSNINKVVDRISEKYQNVVYDKATNISNEMVGENGLITTANETVKGFFHKIRGIVSYFGQTINSKVFKKKKADMSIYNKEGTKIEELSNNDNIVTKKYKIGDNLDSFLDTLQETAGLDKNVIERIKHDFNTNGKSDVSILDIVNAYQDLLLEKKILEKYSSSNESKFPSFQTIRSTTNNTIQSVTVEDSNGKHTIDGIDISDIINNEINLYEKAIAYFYNQGWITSEINSLTETMLNNATLGNDTVFVMATNNMQDVNAITSFKLSNNQMSEAIYFKNDNKPEHSNKDDKDLNSIIQDLIVKHYNNNGNGGGGKRNLRISINSRISNYKNNRSRFQLPNVDAPNVVEYTINQGQSPTTTNATSTTTNDNQAEVSLDEFVNNRIIAKLTQMKREYPHIAPLINMIEKLVLDLKNNIEKNMKIYYSQIPDDAKGAFRVDNQGNISITIYSNSNLFTELHEFIHAATTFALRYDSNESNILVSNIKRINRLMYNSINKLNPSDRSSLMARLGLDNARFDYIFGINGELSLEALSEFIATALSEPKIMEYLNGLEVQVEYQRQDPTKGTKLSRFFKAMPILIKYVTQLVLHKLNQEPLSALEFLSQNVSELSQYNTKESAQKLIEARDNRPIEKINKALVKAASLLTRTTVERYAQGRDIGGMVEELEKHYQSKMAMKLLEKSAYKIMKYPKGARHVATAVWLMASFLYSKKNYFSKNPYRREVLQEAIADLRQRLIEHTIFDTKIGLDLGITASRWLKDQVNIINRATSMRTAVDFEIEQSLHEMKQTIKAFLRQTEAMEKFLSNKKTEDEYVENVFKLILHNNIGDYFWGRDIVANEVEDLADFILNPSDSNIHKMREMSKEKQAKAFELLGIKDDKDISNSISQTVQDLAYTRITDINPGKLNISNIEMALKYAGLLKSGVELTSNQKEAVRLLHQSITLEAIAMPHRDTQGLDANLTYYKERTKLVRDIMINDNPNIDYSELHEGVIEGMKSMIRLHKRCVDAQYTARMLDMNSNKRFMEKPGDLFLIDNKDMYKNIYTFSRDTADAHYLDSYKPYQYNSDLDLKVLDPNQSIEDPTFNYDKEKTKLETLGYELLYTNDKGVETWGYNGPAKYSPSRMTRGYMFDTNDHKGRVEYLLDEVEYDAMKDIEREEFWEGAKDRFVDIGKQYSDNYMPSSKDLEYNRYSSLGGSETIMKVSGLSNQAFEAITNSSRSVYDGFASLEDIAQKNNIRGFINNQLFYQIIESHKDIMKRKPNLAENGTTRPHHSEVLFRRNGDKLEFNEELQDKYGFTLTRRDIKDFQRLWNFLDLDSEVNTNDGNIYIDSRFIDVVFGHKKLDLGRSFEDTHPGLFKLSKLIQTGIQSLGREMKNNIIMRNPKLVAINAIGNFWGVVGEGVPAKQAAEAWVHYVNELNDYKRQITEKKLLETQINNYKRNIYRTDDNLTAEQKEDRVKQLEQQLAEINRSIEGNAVTPLIRAGMYSNIVEDAETEGFKYFDELAEFAIKTGNLSTERAEAMRELFMTENSNVYKMMGDMTRAGDFIPRVILYYHIKSKGPQLINRIVNGKIIKDIETQDELHGRALDEARDRFINYNTPMWSPTARALEALNIIMFSKYRLAVQYQILQAFKNAPVQATGMVALEMALQASGLKFNPVSSYLAESVAFGGNLPSGLWKGVGDVLSSAWRWKFVTP